MNCIGSNSIGLLMANANSYDYPGPNPSPFWTGFTGQHQFSDGDPIEDDPEGERTNLSCFENSQNELDSSDLIFNGQDPYDNQQSGCTTENRELILFHNEDQTEDYTGDPRNLYYEFDWACFPSWFGLGEDEQDWNGQELRLEQDCSSEAVALLESILGYWS